MTKFVGGLRMAAGLTVLAAMIGAGWGHRSPWIVVLATPAFTALYALGKWNAWKMAWRIGGLKQIILATLTTLPIQAVLAGVLYLVGLGLGRLITGYRPIAELSAADVAGAGMLFVVGVVLSAVIIRLEGDAVDALLTPEIETLSSEDVELEIDPRPLTSATFFTSPGYWRQNAARQALEQRGEVVERQPLAAREDMIAAAEERLGVRLPDTLRTLYGVMNGGSVGWLHVPMKADPKPVYDDWRGAFSIDYSALAPLKELRTVAEHYEDFTHDPEDVPANADRLVILQARYGDMTLLDYSTGTEPRVLIVDYDKYEDDPIDIAFDDFDTFFAALRRNQDYVPDRPRRPRDLSSPMGQDVRPRRFWGDANPHPFYANAASRENGWKPDLVADDGLVAQTQARLGVTLPASLVMLWRSKNGGGVASRFIVTDASGSVHDREVVRFLLPMEYVVTLADLSDNIAFPPGEIPWKLKHADADRLIVLEADHDRAVLLDYRGRTDDDPAVLVVDDLGEPLADATRFAHWDELLTRLRFQKAQWDDVAKPHAADLADAAS